MHVKFSTSLLLSTLAFLPLPATAWADARRGHAVVPGNDGHTMVIAPSATRFQVGPLALILVALFALPTALFLIVSFYDYDRVGIYPAFIMDNYRDLLTTPATTDRRGR